MTMSDLAVLTVRRLCEDGQMGEPDERPLTEWAEFADMTEDDFWDYMAGLPSTFLTDGGEYLLDYQNNFILQAEGKGPNYRFDDEIQMNRFLTYHEAKEDMEVDAERHVYVSKREPAVKPIPMEQKRAHVVYEFGPYVFLKLPLDPDFIQREGIDMQHPVTGDTRIITYDGTFPIASLVGQKPRLLTRKVGTHGYQAGFWTESEIRAYPPQPVYAVELQRNGRIVTVRTTADHRWYA